MKLLVPVFLFAAAAASALGMMEDPLEVQTKTFTLAAVRSLEIRGQIQFELVRGEQPRVTVRTTRALFDQLTVSNWWGAATVAIESGLRGPRERGTVTVTIELPALESLTVLDRSSGKVAWPSADARVRVGESSAVALQFQGSKLQVEASWLSTVQVTGTASTWLPRLRHQARINATGLAAQSVSVVLDEGSDFESGTVALGGGVARHGSFVTVPDAVLWKGLVLKEDSVLKTRTD